MTIGVGVVGYGFMGKAHCASYARAAQARRNCAVLAICDARGPAAAAAQAGNLDTGAADEAPPGARWHDQLESMLEDPAIDLISVCTPTDTHVALAETALAAGKHVLVEKPVALEAGAVRRLAEAARAAERLCMPAMCMRFWPGWDWLKAAVDDGRYGAVRSCTLQRLGRRPAWGPDFYESEQRCGGAMFDLHVHDVDFLHWVFGRPRAVTTRGDAQHCVTLYDFDGQPLVACAEGAWDNAAGFGFRMRYNVVFEEATADFDLARSDHLLLSEGDSTRPVELADHTGYDGEILALLDALARGDSTPPATLEEAAEVLEILAAERSSARERTTVVLAQ
ncbi:MAG: Gfo/Idh/MocA family protein [Phycisphaerales bacterium JB039]